MSIANLHSLLNRPFYIEQSYGQGFLPLVLNLLNPENSISAGEKDDDEEKKETHINYMSLNGSSNYGEDAEEASFVSVISIKTPIVKYNQFFGPRGTQSYIRTMEGMKNNKSIAGIVLDIDSGGGQVYGTPEFHDYIKDYPKPVVTYTGGLLCSAAYYIGNAASHIIANKRSDAIGSIGAYAQILDVAGYYEKLGAKLHTIYSSKSTEKNKAYREVIEGNYDSYVKAELDPVVDTFIADMKATRPGIKEECFKGGTWTGVEAVEMGLVDENGTLQTAVNKVFELSKSNNNPTQKANAMTDTKKYAKINAVLGIEALEGLNAEGAHMSESFLDTLEAHLNDAETKQTEAVQAVQTQLDAANTAATAVTTALETICTNHDVETGADNQATIAAISSTMDTLASADSGKTTVDKEQDKIDTETSDQFLSETDVEVTEMRKSLGLD